MNSIWLTLYLSSIIIPLILIGKWWIKTDLYRLLSSFYIFQSVYIVPPALDNLSGALSRPSVNILILITIVANVSIFWGYFITIPLRKNFLKKRNNTNRYDLLFTGSTVFLLIYFSSVCLFNFALFKQITTLSGLLAPYLSESSSSLDQFERLRLYSVSLIGGSGLVAWRYSSNRILQLLILLFLMEVCLLLLLRGYRTGLVLCLLPFILYQCTKFKRLVVTLGLFSFAMVMLGQVIDIIRARGWTNMEGIDFLRYPMSVGEFGQTARGFEIFFDLNTDWLLGETIIFGPILNMLSTVGVEYEPISTLFAKLASGSGPLFGFGFSYQLEAIWNFGYFAPMYFLIIGVAFGMLELHFKRFGDHGIVAISIITSTLLLFQRIDLSVYLKMNILTFACLFLFLSLIKRKKSNGYYNYNKRSVRDF